MKIYLAGPIHHVTPEQATGWRRRAHKELEGYAEILDPTAGKDLYRPGINTTYFSPEYIVETDIAMIDSVDMLIVDISHHVPCWGTAMEIRHAWTAEKAILTWGQTNKQSYWIRYHATRMFDTLDKLITFVKGMDL